MSKMKVVFIKLAALVALIFLTWIACMLSGCSPQKRLNRLVKKNPSLVSVDTVFSNVQFITEKRSVDTVFLFSPDTVFLFEDKVILKVKVDTVKRTVFASCVCLPDTVFKTVPQYINKVIVSKEKDKVKTFLFSLLIIIIIAGLANLVATKFLKIKKVIIEDDI